MKAGFKFYLMIGDEMDKLIVAEYQGNQISFTESGWFNATEVASKFNKRPTDWLALESTKEYISTLAEILGSEKSSLLKTKRGGRGTGGSTWLHPKLAVRFA